MANTDLAQTLLTETEVAKQLHVSLAALRKWRVLNRDPQFLKIGSLVRYRQADINQWLESVPVGGGPQNREGVMHHAAGNVDGAVENRAKRQELLPTRARA
ncbi:MAG TPA: helix-turn-helix domain-containing protein [Bryobacteraceae bacterium]|jgi:predicted DNA-binding transcriptional regulator AlpA|nr:helix-turn-helix domain-containing protein [Bryobacteraceae bacterium]